MSDAVTSLLIAEGLAPRLSWPGFSAAVRLAEAVSQTIEPPIRRAQFVADAAAALDELDYPPFEGLEDWAAWLAETAEAESVTPCGSTELWGSLLSDARFAAAKLAKQEAEDREEMTSLAKALGLLKD